jgi:hypothetical protein
MDDGPMEKSKVVMATSSAEFCGCKHQAKNGHAKGEQTQSHLPSNSVRVAGNWIHAMTKLIH